MDKNKNTIITKAELAAMIVKDMKLKKNSEGNDFLNSFEKCLTEIIKSGDTLKLQKLFSIEIVEKPSRVGTNPQTGKKMTIKARKTLKFKVSDTLKKLANA